MAITVYTTPSCQQCTATKRWLDRRGIQFTEQDATEPATLAALTELGFTTAPVVAAGTTVENTMLWSGFDPGLLEAYAQEMAA